MPSARYFIQWYNLALIIYRVGIYSKQFTFTNQIKTYIVEVYLEAYCKSWDCGSCYKARPLRNTLRRKVHHYLDSFFTDVNCFIARATAHKLSILSKHFRCLHQCNQIGWFLKVLGDKLSFKSSQIFDALWCIFKSITFQVKTAVVTFRATLEKMGFFFQESGHSGFHIPNKVASLSNLCKMAQCKVSWLPTLSNYSKRSAARKH